MWNIDMYKKTGMLAHALETLVVDACCIRKTPAQGFSSHPIDITI